MVLFYFDKEPYSNKGSYHKQRYYNKESYPDQLIRKYTE